MAVRLAIAPAPPPWRWAGGCEFVLPPGGVGLRGAAPGARVVGAVMPWAEVAGAEAGEGAVRLECDVDCVGDDGTEVWRVVVGGAVLVREAAATGTMRRRHR